MKEGEDHEDKGKVMKKGDVAGVAPSSRGFPVLRFSFVREHP